MEVIETSNLWTSQAERHQIKSEIVESYVLNDQQVDNIHRSLVARYEKDWVAALCSVADDETVYSCSRIIDHYARPDDAKSIIGLLLSDLVLFRDDLSAIERLERTISRFVPELSVRTRSEVAADIIPAVQKVINLADDYQEADKFRSADIRKYEAFSLAKLMLILDSSLGDDLKRVTESLTSDLNVDFQNQMRTLIDKSNTGKSIERIYYLRDYILEDPDQPVEDWDEQTDYDYDDDWQRDVSASNETSPYYDNSITTPLEPSYELFDEDEETSNEDDLSDEFRSIRDLLKKYLLPNEEECKLLIEELKSLYSDEWIEVLTRNSIDELSEEEIYTASEVVVRFATDAEATEVANFTASANMLQRVDASAREKLLLLIESYRDMLPEKELIEVANILLDGIYDLIDLTQDLAKANEMKRKLDIRRGEFFYLMRAIITLCPEYSVILEDIVNENHLIFDEQLKNKITTLLSLSEARDELLRCQYVYDRKAIDKYIDKPIKFKRGIQKEVGRSENTREEKTRYSETEKNEIREIASRAFQEDMDAVTKEMIRQNEIRTPYVDDKDPRRYIRFRGITFANPFKDGGQPIIITIPESIKLINNTPYLCNTWDDRYFGQGVSLSSEYHHTLYNQWKQIVKENPGIDRKRLLEVLESCGGSEGVLADHCYITRRFNPDGTFENSITISKEDLSRNGGKQAFRDAVAYIGANYGIDKVSTWEDSKDVEFYVREGMFTPLIEDFCARLSRVMTPSKVEMYRNIATGLYINLTVEKDSHAYFIAKEFEAIAREMK